MTKESNINIFLKLLRCGLWERLDDEEVVKPATAVDWGEVYRLAEEQSVIGLIAAGIEKSGITVPQMVKLQFVGATLQMEQRNQAMNEFVASLIEKMREAGIFTLLVKGQGVAQCYERPLWRACGDVDLFLDDEDYEKAKELLIPVASDIETEYVREKHLGMTIGGWVVELHGRLYCGLSSRIDKELDRLQHDAFQSSSFRAWNNNGVQVYQLKAENDVFYVFTHILQHFYKEGIGLRQICDWCRLLWTYKETLNCNLLEQRIRRAGLMSEWKAFAAFAINWLGMPADAMPLYGESPHWNKKAKRIMDFIMMSGNMGHKRDTGYMKYPYLVRKCFSMGRRIVDLFRHARIFPLDSLRFSFAIMWNGVRSAVRGE